MNHDQSKTQPLSPTGSSPGPRVLGEKQKGSWPWRACCLGVVLLSAASFSPLAIPAGRFEPMLAGLPLTLWAGLLIAFAIVALTCLGARVHPSREPDSDPP